VLDILATVTETSEVRHRPHLELFDSGLLDSLKTVELIVAISDTFGVQLTPSEFDRDEWSTPRQIVDYMQRRIGV
jgi:D-alanine--poly(phosphoribitol) ligase subunit 2